MHKDDLGMVEHGILFYSRKSPNIIIRILVKVMLPLLWMNLKKKDRFIPDIYLQDGDDLSEYVADKHITLRCKKTNRPPRVSWDMTNFGIKAIL